MYIVIVCSVGYCMNLYVQDYQYGFWMDFLGFDGCQDGCMKYYILMIVGLFCGVVVLILIGFLEQLFVCEGFIFFEKDIFFVFECFCGECYSVKENFFNLCFDIVEYIFKGGDFGKVFEFGNLDESFFYVCVFLLQDDFDFMLVEGELLNEDEVEILCQWIEQGVDFGGWIGEG